MEGAIISLICGIAMIIKFVVILCKYDAIKGTATGKGTLHFEEFSYEYKGRSYISSAPRPGFNKRRGKEYRIWVNRDNPQKIQSNNEFYAMGTGAIFILIAVMILIRYY